MSFASVITDLGKDELIRSFDNIVVNEVRKVMLRYRDIFDRKELPKEFNRATYALEYLVSETEIKEKKIILLIDEYDNFANNIMSGNRILYDDLVHEGGYIRTFYKSIKEGTRAGVIARTFITGVSPIMLDDVTSGANIFTITSNDKDLNGIMGFTEEELKELMEYYKLYNLAPKEELHQLFKDYCNGYKFNKSVQETIYNTDMVLYIVNNMVQKQEYPEKFIDENVKMDYGRLRSIAENFITKEEMLEMIEGNEVGPVEIKELKGDLNKLSYEAVLALNREIIEEKQREAEMQLERYMQEHNILNDSDRILKKVTVVTIGRRYVIYDVV